VGSVSVIFYDVGGNGDWRIWCKLTTMTNAQVTGASRTVNQ